MAVTLGQTATWALYVYTSAGVLADLGGGDPTVTVTLPDATTTTATVTNEATGTYYAALTTTQAGRYRATWTGTGTNSGGLPKVDLLDVLPADPRHIIPLQSARDHLNIPAADFTHDEEIRDWLAVGTIVVEHIIGPVLSETRTETASGGWRSAIVLPTAKGTVTGVTENGTTLTDGTDFCWDEHGVLWRGATPGAGVWSGSASRNVVVTYTVGTGIVPANVVAAGKILVKHWFTGTQQISTMRPDIYSSSSEPEPTTMVAGYAVPNRAVDLLKAGAVDPARQGHVRVIGPVLLWLDAAYDALVAGLPSTVHVHDGPLVTMDPVAGSDVVIVGHDGDDETGLGAEVEGGWHGVGGLVPTSGEATVWVTVICQSGAPVSMRARRALAKTLAASVEGVLFPNPRASALSVDGVGSAEPARYRVLQLPQQAGNRVDLSIGVRLRLEPIYT